MILLLDDLYLYYLSLYDIYAYTYFSIISLTLRFDFFALGCSISATASSTLLRAIASSLSSNSSSKWDVCVSALYTL